MLHTSKHYTERKTELARVLALTHVCAYTNTRACAHPCICPVCEQQHRQETVCWITPVKDWIQGRAASHPRDLHREQGALYHLFQTDHVYVFQIEPLYITDMMSYFGLTTS